MVSGSKLKWTQKELDDLKIVTILLLPGFLRNSRGTDTRTKRGEPRCYLINRRIGRVFSSNT
jgi:hypothetical protein